MAAVDWKKILALLGSGIVVYAGMRYLLPIAIPFLLGWFLASMVLPAARWMEKKWRIPRGIGGGFLIGLLTLFLAVGAWKLLALLVMQLGNLLDKLGLLAERLDGILNTCCQVVESYTGISAESIRQFLVYQAGRLQEQVQNNMEASWMGYFVTVIKGAITLVGGVIIVAIFGTLVVKDMEAFRERMNRGRITGKIMRIGRKICVAGGRYLKAQVCIMSVVGLVCMAGFWLLKNPYFVVAGVAVGILDALPLIGVGTILIPWALIWCLQGEYVLAVGYFLLYVAADLVRQFLEPRILGKQMGIHPALMLVSVYGGFFLYGFAGFFLGPVTVLIIKALWEEMENPSCEKINKKQVKKVQKS